jgi:cytosolic phospholipase A2
MSAARHQLLRFSRRRGVQTATLALTAGCVAYEAPRWQRAVASSSTALLIGGPALTTHNDSPAIAANDASLVASARRAPNDDTGPSRRNSRRASTDPKRGDAELIEQTSGATVYTPGFEDDDENSWALFSANFANLIEGISRIEWGGLGDKLADFMVPSWARHLPEAIKKLQFELTMGRGSLADEVWEEAHDPNINPEIMWDARVRVGEGLGRDELLFKDRRKKYMVKAFAKYLGLNEQDVDPEDIPVIGMCGSGGGLRAMVAGTSSYYSAQQAGLFDIVTYTAGVSGSCWLQTLFYSTLGKQSHAALLRHIKSRVGTHIAFPPPALKLATSAPTNKFILSGFIEKLKGDPDATFGLVDIYSLLLGLRYLVPHGDLDVHPEDLKLSNQRNYVESGQLPMPIYTAVRHEIPLDDEDKEEVKSNPSLKEKVEEKVRKEAWFQWIEMTPWEVGCEDFGAWIPTWSLGRPFDGGRNQLLDTGIAVPEYRLSLLLGIWGSAFTATLAHYYKEVKPVLAGITGFGGLDELLEEKNDEFIKIHPIEPATIPNWAYGMKGQLPSTCPDSVPTSNHLQLMDAGMSNNLPIYPLLRQGRDVDILIAFDASADIQKENWLSVVDGYAKQRGIKSWPVGTGWPKESSKPEENAAALTQAYATSPKDAAERLENAKQEGAAKESTSENEDKVSKKALQAKRRADETGASSALGYCNIWVGSKAERSDSEEPPPSKRVAWEDPEDSTFHLSQPDAGIAVIYFPLLPNPKVPGVDPDKTDFLSTWNFIYTPEQVDKVVELAKTNFQAGEEMTKRTVRAVYERKKKAREGAENRKRVKGLRKKLRDTGDAFG